MRFTFAVTVTKVIALCAVLLPAPVGADSWRPFRNFRQIDPTGRYYLVVRKDGGPEDPGRGTPIRFEIAERKPGTSPVTSAEDWEESRRTVVPNPDVKVRDGDAVLGRGRLARCPLEILISSTGLGFVGLDVRGYNYGSLRSGDALVIVTKDGTVRHRKNLIDLFSEGELGQILHTAGGIVWCGSGWIDEARQHVVVLSSALGGEHKPIPRLLRVVSLETGQVQEGSAAQVLTALSKPTASCSTCSNWLRAEVGPGVAGPGASSYRTKAALGTRLKAAVALAAVGDRRGRDLMLRAIFEEPSEERHYAIDMLPFVLGDDAAPVLCDVVRRLGESWAYPPSKP